METKATEDNVVKTVLKRKNNQVRNTKGTKLTAVGASSTSHSFSSRIKTGLTIKSRSSHGPTDCRVGLIWLNLTAFRSSIEKSLELTRLGAYESSANFKTTICANSSLRYRGRTSQVGIHSLTSALTITLKRHSSSFSQTCKYVKDLHKLTLFQEIL